MYLNVHLFCLFANTVRQVVTWCYKTFFVERLLGSHYNHTASMIGYRIHGTGILYQKSTIHVRPLAVVAATGSFEVRCLETLHRQSGRGCGTFMKKTCSTESTGTQCTSNYRSSCERYSVLTHMYVRIIQYHTCLYAGISKNSLFYDFKHLSFSFQLAWSNCFLGSVLHRFLDGLVSCTYTLTDIEGSHLYVSEGFKTASMNIMWFHMTCLIWLDLIHMISHHFIWFHHDCIMISLNFMEYRVVLMTSYSPKQEAWLLLQRMVVTIRRLGGWKPMGSMGHNPCVGMVRTFPEWGLWDSWGFPQWDLWDLFGIYGMKPTFLLWKPMVGRLVSGFPFGARCYVCFWGVHI